MVLIRPLIHTGSDTDTQILANSAHLDSQRVESPQSIGQVFPSLDLVMPLTLVILADDFAIGRRQFAYAALQAFQFLLTERRFWMRWQRHVLLQIHRLCHVALPQILTPDVPCNSEAIRCRAWAISTLVDFADYNVNRLIKQVIWIWAAFVNEVPHQPHSNRLVLANRRLIIWRKPTEKLAKGLCRQRLFDSACHHRRHTIDRPSSEVDSPYL